MVNAKSQNPMPDKILTCFHCGNKTMMPQKGEFKWGSVDEGDDFAFVNIYRMYACPICHQVSLMHVYNDESMIEINRYGDEEYYTEDTVLYPTVSIISDLIPEKIKESFEGALKTKNINNNACLIMLRRTLECIMIDQGAIKRGLKDKIEEIAKKGLLPDTLKEASSLTKILGDSAAHGEELDIDQHDVSTMAEFVEYIIEYLYIMPNKMRRYKEKLSIS